MIAVILLTLGFALREQGNWRAAVLSLALSVLARGLRL